MQVSYHGLYSPVVVGGCVVVGLYMQEHFPVESAFCTHFCTVSKMSRGTELGLNGILTALLDLMASRSVPTIRQRVTSQPLIS